MVELLSDILFNPAIIPRLFERYNKALEESNSQNHTELEEVKQQIKGKTKLLQTF